MLDDSVTYSSLSYWCDRLEHLRVDFRVDGNEDEVLRFTLRHSNPYSSAPDEAAQVAFGFGAVNAMRRDIGWID
jgi:hypothetical protein